MIKKLKPLFAILIALVFGIVLYFFGTGEFYKARQYNIFFQDANLDCDLHKSACTVFFDKNKTIELKIDNQPLKPGKILKYIVKTTNINNDELLISIVGVNMNMGLFEYELAKKNENTYEANGILPNCTGKMIWKISVIAKQQEIGANFILELE